MGRWEGVKMGKWEDEISQPLQPLQPLTIYPFTIYKIQEQAWCKEHGAWDPKPET